jgi:hypothetical protein
MLLMLKIKIKNSKPQSDKVYSVDFLFALSSWQWAHRHGYVSWLP